MFLFVSDRRWYLLKKLFDLSQVYTATYHAHIYIYNIHLSLSLTLSLGYVISQIQGENVKMCLFGSGMCCLLREDTKQKVSFKSLDVKRTRKSMRTAEKDDADSDTDNDAPEVNAGLQETQPSVHMPLNSQREGHM